MIQSADLILSMVQQGKPLARREINSFGPRGDFDVQKQNVTIELIGISWFTHPP